MAKVYIGGIDARTTEREVEDEFRTFGPIRKVWVARRPPGFAFVEYDDARDAQDAVKKLDGKHGWRVEISRKPDARGGTRDGREGCYECGETGHFARECPKRSSGRGRDDRDRDRDDRRRSPPRRRSSRSPPRRRSRSPPRRERSPPPRDDRRSPRRSPSPAREKPAEKRSPSPKKSSPPHDNAPAADATSV